MDKGWRRGADRDYGRVWDRQDDLRYALRGCSRTRSVRGLQAALFGSNTTQGDQSGSAVYFRSAGGRHREVGREPHCLEWTHLSRKYAGAASEAVPCHWTLATDYPLHNHRSTGANGRAKAY